MASDITTVLIMGIGMWLPFSPLAATLGFVHLPLLYWPILFFTLLCYVVLTQLVKMWLLRRSWLKREPQIARKPKGSAGSDQRGFLALAWKMVRQG